MAMEYSILRPWPSPVRGRGLRAAVCLTVLVLYRTVQLHSERLRTRRPIMGFHFIPRAYHPHLRASFSKPSFRSPCSIGWRRETPLRPRLWTKGLQKVHLFADLLHQIHFPELRIHIKNLEDLHCPPLTQLCPATQPWSICQKAVRLARWLAEQGLA